MDDKNIINKPENTEGINTANKLKNEEEELKQYTQERIAKILDAVKTNPNNRYWTVKYVHASGHGGQKINHGNSKAQLRFDIDAFYKDFDIKDKTREDFVKIVGEKNITHNQLTLILENQETRDALKNKENVLKHLETILSELFKQEKQRIKTEIPHEQKEERLDKKGQHSEKKKRRKKIRPQDIE